MRNHIVLLMAMTALLVVGCSTVKKVNQALLGAPQATVSDVLSPFVPDPADTNKVIPNPALVGTVNTAGGALGPWGILGATVLGGALVAGATHLNKKK